MSVCRSLPFALFAILFPSMAAQGASFTTANLPSTLGETDTLYVVPPGWYFHPLYNDFVGHTDKYLSQEIRFGYLSSAATPFQLELAWRFITPAFEPHENKPHFNPPVGRFADWLSLDGAYAWTQASASGQWKEQVFLGLGDIGNHGARDLQVAVHKTTNNPTMEYTYADQPLGLTGSAGIECAYALPEYAGVAVQVAAGGTYDKFMLTPYAQANALVSLAALAPDLALGFEGTFYRQLESDALQGLRPTRYELSAGLRLSKYYTPTIKYMSPFLSRDPYGQLFVDFLSVNIPN